jgi:hypothetical protein
MSHLHNQERAASWPLILCVIALEWFPPEIHVNNNSSVIESLFIGYHRRDDESSLLLVGGSDALEKKGKRKATNEGFFRR